MSIHDERDRQRCEYCNNPITYGEKHLHWGCKKKFNNMEIKPKIVNIKNGIKGKYLYIGRANKTYNQEESIFHNPFVIGKDGTRAEVIEKFKNYAPTNKELMDSLYLLDKENFIGCYCDYPQEDCHGRILIELREKQKLKKKKTKLAIVGSRSIQNEDIVFNYLDKYKDKIDYIISGGARGIDSFANDWCKLNGIPIKIYYPDWGKGKNQGFIRNEYIINEADFITAFWDGNSKGTKHDIDLCVKLGKKHRVIIVND